MQKGFKAILLAGLGLASVFWLTSCATKHSTTQTMSANQPYASCDTISGWPIVHDGSLNYDFRCAKAPKHHYTCYGAYPGQGNNVAMYLYKGATFNSQPSIAGPVTATVTNPSDLAPLQEACVKMYQGYMLKKHRMHKHHHSA